MPDLYTIHTQCMLGQKRKICSCNRIAYGKQLPLTVYYEESSFIFSSVFRPVQVFKLQSHVFHPVVN